MQKGTLVPGPSGNTNIVYWPSQISPRVMWICLSFRLNLNCGRSGKSAILLFVGFLKIKNSPTSLSLIFENSLPKGFSWKNMKKSVISVLKMNSRYLQSSGFKQLERRSLKKSGLRIQGFKNQGFESTTAVQKWIISYILHITHISVVWHICSKYRTLLTN